MSQFKHARVTVEDRVGVLTLDHPPANALDTATMADLSAAFDELSADPNVKVIVITGAGQFAFVAGADINEIAQIESPEQARRMVLGGHAVMNRIESSEKPVIAAVNALALGGGLELAMACHIRILSERSRIGQPETNLGIIPGFGGTQRLTRLVGTGKALELILSGDIINAQEAYRLGIADRVVPAGQALDEAMGLARKIAAKSTLATSAAMRAVIEGSTMSLADGLLHEAELFSGLAGSHDFREGPTAFLQKRQPNFTDN